MYINLLAMMGSICNNHCHRLMIRAKQELQCVYYCSYLKKKKNTLTKAQINVVYPFL